MELKALKVSEVNQYIKRILISDPILYNLNVEGEISNFKHHYSGHMYFTLKDDKSRIKCVMFSSDCEEIRFAPEDGMKVTLSGYVSVYEKDGNYQLYVKTMKQRGLGELFIAFEELKRKLQAEGLFDDIHKKPIPIMPRKIGVVTSSTGAAVKDIITVIKRRFPSVDILIFPVLVQGDKAHTEICKGLSYFDNREDIDIVITGRGGGSIEELWAFNEEDVARTIYSMRTPVISAVGHETDFTIADFVADLRAPTPSVAGELAVPMLDDMNERLNEILFRLQVIFKGYMNYRRNDLEYMKNRILYNNPIDKVRENSQRLDSVFKDLVRGIEKKSYIHKNYLEGLGNKLNALSPLSILTRGYTITTSSNGQVVKSVEEININEELYLRFKDGKAKVEVKKIYENILKVREDYE